MGPISLALYIPEFDAGRTCTDGGDEISDDENMRKGLRRHILAFTEGSPLTSEEVTCIQSHVSWHAVIKSVATSTNDRGEQASASLSITYPFNVMRNAAADGVVGGVDAGR